MVRLKKQLKKEKFCIAIKAIYEKTSKDDIEKYWDDVAVKNSSDNLEGLFYKYLKNKFNLSIRERLAERKLLSGKVEEFLKQKVFDKTMKLISNAKVVAYNKTKEKYKADVKKKGLFFPYAECMFGLKKSTRGLECLDADVYATRAYLEHFKLKAIFRGHQDYAFGFKLLIDPDKQKEKLKNIENIKQSNTDYSNGPYNWRDIISKQDQESAEGFYLSSYFPVFTFTTATEPRGLAHDFFGIVTTAKKYDNWRIKPYEIALDEGRAGKYVKLEKKPDKAGNLITFSHVEKPQALKGVFESILGSKKEEPQAKPKVLFQKYQESLLQRTLNMLRSKLAGLAQRLAL